jgi:hypothetical protein
MKRLLVVCLLAAAPVAAGTIAPTAGAFGGCSDRAFYNADVAAAKSTSQTTGLRQSGLYNSAAAVDLVGWHKLLNAPVPCSSLLRSARTHALRWYADDWRSDTANASGDASDGFTWLAAGTHEADLLYAALVQYQG